MAQAQHLGGMVSGLQIVGFAVALSASTCAYADPQADAPGHHVDLLMYKLQTPIARGDSVLEVSPPMLMSYISPDFYYDGMTKALVFACPDNGATTRESHFPRSELRTIGEWTFSGMHTLSATLAVTQQPASGDIIIGQIHGNGQGTEAFKIRWINGDIVAGVKISPGNTEARYPLLHGLALGQRFSYTIAQSDHVVTVTVNGVSHSFSFDPSWDTAGTVYFKAGNYLQDNSASGSTGVVRFYALSTQ